MVTHTLQGLQERVEKLEKRSVRGFQIKDSLEAENIKAVCMVIVEDYTRPCPDRLHAARIAIAAIEVRASMIMEQARKLEQPSTEQYDTITVRCRGRIVKHAA